MLPTATHEKCNFVLDKLSKYVNPDLVLSVDSEKQGLMK
jgi:hypothetical protein